MTLSDLPASQRAALDALVSARVAWSREDRLHRLGIAPEVLAELATLDLIVRWDVPRKRLSRPPILLWTLTPWGAFVAEKILDERPISEVPFWRDTVSDLAALGPIRILSVPGERPMPHPDRMPDLRPDPQDLDAESESRAAPIQATDPVSGEPWHLFAQRFPVLIDRRLKTRKPAKKPARKGRKRV